MIPRPGSKAYRLASRRCRQYRECLLRDVAKSSSVSLRVSVSSAIAVGSSKKIYVPNCSSTLWNMLWTSESMRAPKSVAPFVSCALLVKIPRSVERAKRPRLFLNSVISNLPEKLFLCVHRIFCSSRCEGSPQLPLSRSTIAFT